MKQNKYLIMKPTIFLLLLFFYQYGIAQVISGDSPAGNLNIRPIPTQPPIIADLQLKFVDGNNDRILDADEEAVISFILHNKGKGNGYYLATNISSDNTDKTVIYEKPVPVYILEPNNPQTITIPVKGSMELKDGQVTFEIDVTEGNGFGSDPVRIMIPTAAYKYPKMEIGEYAFSSDAGEEIQKGLPITLTTMVQNTGRGKAENVNITFDIPNQVFVGGKVVLT